jgi:hypothetical protein
MDAHLAPENARFCVAKLRNSKLLRALCALNQVFSACNLMRPE